MHGPTQPGERIHALDVIRGFALLGILLMNIEYFQRPLQAIMLGFDASQTGIDHAVAWIVFVLVQGKFYTMFSFLFGLGFVVFLDRAMQRGDQARLRFIRRLVALLLIGAAHAFLIWGGDILLSYAAVGFLLLLFANTPASRLWKYGLLFFFIPVALFWLGAFGIQAQLESPDGPKMVAEFAADRERLLADIAHGHVVYSSGAYFEAVRWRMHEMGALYLGGGLFFFIPFILGMFLFGAAFGRAGVFRNPDAHRRVFQRMVVIGFALGIPAALFVGMNATGIEMTFPTLEGAAFMTVSSIANIALCAAYIGTIMLLLRRAGSGQILMRLAPAGRMALTNYLTHSVVFTLIFYGYGLGFYGEIGRAGATVMAIALYAGQVWFSGWWLARHSMGPMERVWRTLTYGRGGHSAT